MSGKDEQRKHRHDEGHVPHVAETLETVTKAVQYTLGLCVLASAVLVIYALTASSGAL